MDYEAVEAIVIREQSAHWVNRVAGNRTLAAAAIDVREREKPASMPVRKQDCKRQLG